MLQANYRVSAVIALGLSMLAMGCGEDGAQASATTSGGQGGQGGSGGGGDDVCPESGVSKGPWVIAVTGSSAKVRWEACAEGTPKALSYAPEAGGAEQSFDAVETPFEVTTQNTAGLNPEALPDEPGTYYMHEAALTGLAPSTCYRYTLAAEDARKGRFCTARASGEPIRFMATGDTNPGLGDDTVRMLDQALAYGPDFTIHAGDIQYYASFLETWRFWFPKMQPMLSQGAFLPSIGNHEDEKPNEFEEYYLRFFGGAGEGTPAYYRFESGGVSFFSLDTEQEFGLASPQGGWLQENLADAASKPGFRMSIVYMHRPFVTCGDSDQHEKERAELAPLFTQYKVPLVIQGHMHGYERFEIDGVTYLTTGGGGGLIGDINENIDRADCGMRVAAEGIHHMMIFDVHDDVIEGKAIDADGVVHDPFTLSIPAAQ